MTSKNDNSTDYKQGSLSLPRAVAMGTGVPLSVFWPGERPGPFEIGGMTAVAVSVALAAKRRQKVDSNQEFIALRAADLAAGITGGYPVSGSFARSTVNFTAGANTCLASLITVVVVGLAALFLMPLLHHLPQAVLAAIIIIIIIAVTGLMDFAMPRRLWRYNKADAAALILTFVTVLAAGVTKGILVGAATTNILHFWRTSRPHIAVVGRMPDTGHFRNVQRHVDRLPDTDFLEQLRSERVFLMTGEAYEKLASPNLP